MVYMAQDAHNSITKLEELIANLKGRGLVNQEDEKRQRKKLVEAKEQLQGWNYVHGLITGDGAQAVWGRLHTVEETIDTWETNPTRVIVRARLNGKASLPKERLDQFNADLKDATSDEAKLGFAMELTIEAHAEDANRHSSERHWQRAVLLICVAFIVVAVGALVFQSLNPALHLLPPPTDKGSPSGFLLVFLVMLFGSLGGLIGGLYKLYIRDKEFGNTRWFDVKPVLLFANVSLGLWTAFFGVLLVSMEIIVGKYQNLAAAILLAIIFGSGQMAVTKYLDKAAAEMLSRSK